MEIHINEIAEGINKRVTITMGTHVMGNYPDSRTFLIPREEKVDIVRDHFRIIPTSKKVEFTDPPHPTIKEGILMLCAKALDEGLTITVSK